MGTFLMGLIFLYVDIRVYTVSILPAFVGYLLLLSGMRSVPSCRSFEQGCPDAVIGAIYSGIVWLMSLLGMEPTGFAALVMALISLALQMLVTYRLSRGMEELENTTGLALESDKLMTAWIILMIPGVCGLFLMPFHSLLGILTYLAALVFYMSRFKYSYDIWRTETAKEVRI